MRYAELREYADSIAIIPPQANQHIQTLEIKIGDVVFTAQADIDNAGVYAFELKTIKEALEAARFFADNFASESAFKLGGRV
jgi:hypothetical protein